VKIYIQTLGCKVNQYETQALETLLTGRGHTICDTDESCDAFIVNTCAVTAESGRKSRQTIRRLKAAHPGAVAAVCGCYSQISPEDAAALGADLIYGSGERLRFADDLEQMFSEKKQVVRVDEPMRRREFEELPAGHLHGRTRAMLKIQDGCDNFCSYCIIPYARGPVRSMPVDNAASEAKRLSAEGYRELVITGIEIASYGKDLHDGKTLADAILAISRSAPEARLRLGSLEPRIINGEFCTALKNAGNLCPHFHLSLQSGCDAVLSRMHRKYNTARFYESVTLLREYFPNCGITADLIVGFPGETEEEFSETLAFIEKCAFSSMHIFPYSRRPGTIAARLPDQVENAVKRDRARRSAAVADEMKKRFLISCVGSVQSVLFETESGGRCVGHAENYCEVSVSGTKLRNTVLNVQITAVKGSTLLGEIIL